MKNDNSLRTNSMPLNLQQSSCLACGQPTIITLPDGTQRRMMLERSAAITDELDKPLMRMNWIRELQRVCSPSTTLGEIVRNAQYHTSSQQYRWLIAMPPGNTLQWLIDTETRLHPGDSHRRHEKAARWDAIMSMATH